MKETRASPPVACETVGARSPIGTLRWWALPIATAMLTDAFPLSLGQTVLVLWLHETQAIRRL